MQISNSCGKPYILPYLASVHNQFIDHLSPNGVKLLIALAVSENSCTDHKNDIEGVHQ